MAWIKLQHISGFDLINLDKVYRILETAPDEITFYDSNSFLPISYTFSSSLEKEHFYNNLIKVIGAIDIASLARQ